MEPGDLFLLLRLIASNIRSMIFCKIEDMLIQLESIIAEDPDAVEWEQADKLYAKWLKILLDDYQGLIGKSAIIMKRIILYAIP